ncbi:thioesterase family protein [Acidobacteria bacterium AH-259-D05]|nr:thioesterase family protein [Acidobacteria bacterium AH-259-D05]
MPSPYRLLAYELHDVDLSETVVYSSGRAQVMERFDNIQPGMTYENIVLVEEKHTVSPTGVPVLSTPMMIAFMELTSAKLIRPLLPPGFTCVGYEVHVKHKAPARLGAKVKVWSKVLEADGRKLLFEVRVNEGEELIGEGVHRRTIVPVPK